MPADTPLTTGNTMNKHPCKPRLEFQTHLTSQELARAV